nr:hypothetical protein [Tanacetum cinerariifolium]GFB27605.1 hypothetical protein [Tanacetum cinerariifolium]
MHNNVDDLIESALNSKLLSINLESQRLDKKKQEVKKIVEQPNEHGTDFSSSCNYTILPIEEPEYSLIMGYEHLSIILETKSDEVIKSSAKNHLPIPIEYEVTFDDESECDVPVKDESSPVFTNVSNPLFDDNGDFTSSDDESFYNEDTLPSSSIPLEDSDFQREEIDIFTGTDDLLPPSIENDDYYSKEDIHFFEELLVDDSISLPENKSFYFDHQNDPSFPRPPLEPPDDEFDFEPNLGEVISAVMNNIDDLNEDECFDPGGDINVSTNLEDDDYFPFMIVIQNFLPYLIYPEVSPLLLFAESEDTIFDPGIFCLEPLASHWDGTFICLYFYPNFDESPIEIFFSICSP